MSCAIVGLGTAVPEERTLQDDILSMSLELTCEDRRQQQLTRMLFRSSGVESRHTCVPWQEGYAWKRIEDPLGPGRGPRTAERMRLYGELAVPLAVTSATRALEDAGMQVEDITHLVTVSCTGFGAPGVDVQLIRTLGLRPTTQRLHIGYMGCHGAINGLRAVRGLVAADPSARVLLCAVELCSLHYRLAWDDEAMIGNALFADGSAALVATGGAKSAGAIWNVRGTGSCLIPDSMDDMSWEVGDHGFEMKLSGRVADSILGALPAWFDGWLDSLNCARADIGAWVVHPGGPRILDAVETALNLPPGATADSRDVLRRLGNMSSPTVLFVLDRLRNSRQPGALAMLGFGPGLMAEAALLDPC